MLASIRASDYNIIILVETGVKPDIASSETFDDSWVLHRYDRAYTTINKVGGGGVFIAVGNCFSLTANHV